MRKRIYEIIEVAEGEDKSSQIYDILMIISIVLSIVPLAFKESNVCFLAIDKITVCIFIIDYLLRIITADKKLNEGMVSFLKYPFTPMAVIDLISILPSVMYINSSLKLLRLFRLFRALRVFRVFKAFRYSKNIQIIINVFKKQRDALTIVGVLAIGYIFTTALVIFNVEPETFDSFFDALYWATVSLTTMGYGDIYAVTNIGQLITMISAVFGIAIVALPAGIITAGYMEEINNKKE
ncbi:MAG: ion transporter [Lachnospiraceae bacterium]|nr:ion transporter [Lachnospiraceae bacterium]MDD6825039.1 ion transporter [Oscillospiraceae bacterium]